MRDTVLIVDDIEINRIILREILKDDYDVVDLPGGLEAVDYLYNTVQTPRAVLLDIMMPGMDGYEVLSLIKANPHTHNIPVLFITAADAGSNESRGLKEGAVDYISKPFNPEVVKARVDNHIQLQRYRAHLESIVEKQASELTATHEHMLETMATIIEYRSLESGTHIRRSSRLTGLLISSMLSHPVFSRELIANQYGSIIKAASLHDIGKIAIPDSILLKPGRLTDEEFEVIKTHSTIGSRIIESIASHVSDEVMYLRHCYDICRHHHERWDGKGYPDGLAGEDIPLSARILSVVDVYDALVNRRCYKPALPHEEAIEIIKNAAGTQFDKRIVATMLSIESKFADVVDELRDPDECLPN